MDTGVSSASNTHLTAAPPSMAERLGGVMEAGQTLERRGQREQARHLYAEALTSCAQAETNERGQLLRWIARTHMTEGEYHVAERFASDAFVLSETADDEAGRGHAVNMLAVIRWKQGDLDEATRLYLTARESALRSGDARLAAMTATNLGIVATVRGEEHQALEYHESALRDAREAGLADQAMHALNNLGMLHTQMGQYEPAGRAFAESVEIGKVLGDLSMCILVHLNVARLRIKQEDFPAARTACDVAMSIASRQGDTHLDGEAEHIHGIIARAAGDVDGAEQHFLRAEDAGVRRKDLILQGESARELSELYRSQGRNRQTLQRLNQAHRLFAQLRARRELADVDRRTTVLERDFLDVARKWGESIESKDIYTQGHCVRVADVACAIWSRVSDGDATSLFWFRIGALLHDVGKLMVPAAVLNKPGKLNDDEWALMRRHPSAGVDLLADIEFPWDVRPIVESHHERWDGRGYPHGLAGNAIPLTARVLCLADVYDALTSRRSYKEPMTHDAAMAIMRGEVGTQFDPMLFEPFEDVMLVGHGAND